MTEKAREFYRTHSHVQIGEGFIADLDALLRTEHEAGVRKNNERWEQALGFAITGMTYERSKYFLAWLIESKFNSANGPKWWMGTSHPAPWTNDSLKAVRFCRKQDAEAAMLTIDGGHMCFVSEHQWGFGAQKPEPAEPMIEGHAFENPSGNPWCCFMYESAEEHPSGDPRRFCGDTRERHVR